MISRFFRNILGARTTAAAIGQGFFANGLLLLLNVATGVITARALGPEGRGEVAALLAVPTFVCFLAPLGLSPAIVFELRAKRSTNDAIAAVTSLLALVLGITAALLSAAAIPWVLGNHQPDLLITAVWLSAFAVPGLFANLAMAVLLGNDRFGACNIVRVAQPILTLAGLTWCMAGPGLTPLSAALVSFCAGFPGLLWNLYLVRPTAPPALKELRAALSRLYQYAVRAASGELLTGLAGQLDKVVIVALYAPREVGLFTVAMSLSRIMLVAPQAATQVLLTRTSGRTPAEVMQTVTRTAAVTLALVSMGALVLGFGGTTLLSLLYSKQFAAGAGLLQVLLLEAGLTAMHQVICQPFMALDRPGAVGVQQAVGVATSIALLFLFSGPLGIVGAAWALLAGAAMRLMTALWMYRTTLELPLPPVFRELGPSLNLLARRLRTGTL